MIHKITIILFVLFLTGSCKSAKISSVDQKETNIQQSLYAEYDVFVKPRQLLLTQKGKLICNTSNSQFSWAFGEKGIQQIEKDGLIDGWFQDELGNIILKDFNNGMLQHREIYFATPYAMKAPLEAINWSFENETKKIGKFMCKKANCLFSGRKYTAWFTPEIPIKDGPWKFHGLPGLIIEIEDEKREYMFNLTKIVYPYREESPMLSLSEKNTVSKTDFYGAYEAEFLKMKKRNLSKQEGTGQMEVTMNAYNPQEIISNENKNED